MNGRLTSCRVVILVKALPRPSKKYGETVCCAGITVERAWKRLYPVRFRQLAGDQQFRRWQWVEFKHRRPTQDQRLESCHVFQDTIVPLEELPPRERFALIDPIITSSVRAAHDSGASLAVIRPSNTRFITKRKPDRIIEVEKRAYAEAGLQRGFLDRDLANFKPSPYEFAFSFQSADGFHTWRCGDWETHATFFKWRQQYGDAETLRKLAGLYNDEYPRRGVVFAIGNMARRPQTWQLLGVIRLDESGQWDLLSGL
jgi:hypothetical protein